MSLASQSCHTKTHATITSLTVLNKVKIPLHNPLRIVHCMHTINYGIPVNFDTRYSLIQMKCQGGVIFSPSHRLLHFIKRSLGYKRCSLTGNKA